MRCYACDINLAEATPVDQHTGRWYCAECFEPTLEVQLAAMSKEIEWSRITDISMSVHDPLLDIVEENYIPLESLLIEEELEEES
jgi:hypothetical protein